MKAKIQYQDDSGAYDVFVDGEKLEFVAIDGDWSFFTNKIGDWFVVDDDCDHVYSLHPMPLEIEEHTSAPSAV